MTASKTCLTYAKSLLVGVEVIFGVVKVALVSLFLSVGATDPAWAQRVCTGPNADAPALQCLEGVFANVLKASFALAGVFAFLFLVGGGVKYIIAGGDEKAAGDARKMITGAISGLLIVILAWGILNILSYYLFGGNQLFTFNIPGP